MKTEKEKSKMGILEQVYESLVMGTRSSVIGKKWLEERLLTVKTSGAVYNSGFVHHNRTQEFKDELEKTGFIKRNGVINQTGKESYYTFGKQEMLFPLRNENGDVVNFMTYGIKSEKKFYLNAEGLYPAFPHRHTHRLFVTHSVMDAATMIEAGILKPGEAVLALFDGEIKAQHRAAIGELMNLEDLILIDGSFAVKKL